jgi:hypothetical protein
MQESDESPVVLDNKTGAGCEALRRKSFVMIF